MIAGSGTVLRPAAQSIPAGPALVAGPFGQSAYDLAVSLGYTGTLSQWLSSLVGAPGATTVAALTDMVDALKTVLRAADIPSARSALGLGNVANVAPADMPVSTAQAAAIAQAISNLVNSSPAALDTLKELADAIGDDPNFAATVAAQIGQKAAASRQITAGAGLTGGGDLSADRALAIAANGVTNAMLAQAPTLTLKANLLGSTAAVTDATLTQLLDAAIGSTRGMVVVRGASGWVALALGSNGTTLQSNGTDLVFAAASPGAGALRYDAQQNLSGSQQDQVRVNVSGPASSAPSATAALVTSDFDRPLFPTGSPTFTMPNGGAGWRSGPVKNANLVTGLVTLAVPSGATLDGVTNGTTILFPYQRARIVQTGATAYATDWIDRSPIIAVQAPGTAVASWDIALPVGYKTFQLIGTGFQPSAGGGQPCFRLSDDGGATLKAGSSDYAFMVAYSTNGATPAATPVAAAQGQLSSPLVASGGNTAHFEMRLDPGGGGMRPTWENRAGFVDSASSGLSWATYEGTVTSISANRANLLRLLWPTGTGIGGYTLIGVP